MWTLVNISFFIFLKIISELCLWSRVLFKKNVDRCYVDKSNTCKDETPSKARPGWVWSCEACYTHQKKKSSESSESSEEAESSESTEKNGKTGNLTHTHILIYITWMNKSWNIVTGVCECNGNLNPINHKGECKHQASTGCGLWSTLHFKTFYYFTRPEPAYGRQGLDWIVGPGYSFGVF